MLPELCKMVCYSVNKVVLKGSKMQLSSQCYSYSWTSYNAHGLVPAMQFICSSFVFILFVSLKYRWPSYLINVQPL